VAKILLERKKESISRNNRLVGAYIYGSRGISPMNTLVGAEFYSDELPSPRKTVKERLKKLFKRN